MENQFDKINLEDLFFKTQRYLITNGSNLEIRSILLGQQAPYMGPFFFIVSHFYQRRKNIIRIAKKKYDTILSTQSNFKKNESKLNEFLNSAF